MCFFILLENEDRSIVRALFQTPIWDWLSFICWSLRKKGMLATIPTTNNRSLYLGNRTLLILGFQRLLLVNLNVSMFFHKPKDVLSRDQNSVCPSKASFWSEYLLNDMSRKDYIRYCNCQQILIKPIDTIPFLSLESNYTSELQMSGHMLVKGHIALMYSFFILFETLDFTNDLSCFCLS